MRDDDSDECDGSSGGNGTTSQQYNGRAANSNEGSFAQGSERCRHPWRGRSDDGPAGVRPACQRSCTATRRELVQIASGYRADQPYQHLIEHFAIGEHQSLRQGMEEGGYGGTCEGDFYRRHAVPADLCPGKTQYRR